MYHQIKSKIKATDENKSSKDCSAGLKGWGNIVHIGLRDMISMRCIN